VNGLGQNSCLVSFILAGMKPLIAETSIIIHAPIEKVWQVLIGVNDYPHWNPFIIKAEVNGDVTKPGTEMKLLVKWKNGKQDFSDELIEQVTPPHFAEGLKQAMWSYRFVGKLHSWGMVHAVRYHWLNQQHDGSTSYRTREEFTGLLSRFIPLADVQDGFERQSNAMRDICQQHSMS